MKRLSLLLVVALCTLVALPQAARAQKVVPAPDAPLSPLAMTKALFEGGTYAKVTYGSPRLRDPQTGERREIFGKLEPYGKVWRLGANDATELTVTRDVMLGGKHLDAGTYTLFAIPNPDNWTLVVNRDLGQWGAYEHNPDTDVLRVDVPAQTSDSIYEAFTMQFKDVDATTKHLVMMWEDTVVEVPITVMD